MVVIVNICFLSHDNIDEHGDYSDNVNVNDDDQVDETTIVLIYFLLFVEKKSFCKKNYVF